MLLVCGVCARCLMDDESSYEGLLLFNDFNVIYNTHLIYKITMNTKYFVRLISTFNGAKFDGPKKSTPDEAIKTLLGANLKGYRIKLMSTRGAETWEGW